MNRSILGRAAFSAAVVLALGFGAREAFALSPALAAARPPVCHYNWECQDWCDRAYGPGTRVGVCDTGCYCYFPE
ncbi:MAG: hypothetical protein ABW277_23545 [Longimicrobiaceae bacterium]